ncbi:MAG: ABC transporter ATP-binding protein [Candidatus Cloacimonetes bacterium]|nr:ABC transporter ATP-binding protein [Candidatus Cloacimonadota bacterium]
MYAIQLNSISKDYFTHNKSISVLKQIDLQVNPGETVALLGHSGSGKSTILTLCAGLDTPTSGTIHVGDLNYSNLNQQKRREEVPKEVSIIFQKFHLMPHLNAIENVLLPLEIQSGKSDKDFALSLLQEVGLQDRLDHYPSQMSGGEQQRVAIARALINKPTILLADEPTGNLDDTTAQEISSLLFKIVKSQNMSMLLVTHDKDLAKLCDKRFELKDGHLNEIYS